MWRKVLEEEESGTTEAENEQEVQLDEWINIVQVRKERERGEKELRDRMQGENDTMTAFRQSMMVDWTDKRALGATAAAYEATADLDDDPGTPGMTTMTASSQRK